MTAVHEVATGYAFLYSTLQADSTLASLAPGGIHRSIAPNDTATPVIIISFQSGIDVLTTTGVRLMVNALYQVKAVDQAANMAGIVAAANQLDIVLGGSQGIRNVSVSGGGYVLSCVREGPLAYDDSKLVVGALWSYLGGLYRVYAEQN